MTSDGIDRLGFLIHDAQRLLRKRFEMRGAGYGLSAAQWRLLVRVVKDEGVPQARLAEILEIEPISVSRLLDRMEAGGWITPPAGRQRPPRAHDLPDRQEPQRLRGDQERRRRGLRRGAGRPHRAEQRRMLIDGLAPDRRKPFRRRSVVR